MNNNGKIQAECNSPRLFISLLLQKGQVINIIIVFHFKSFFKYQIETYKYDDNVHGLEVDLDGIGLMKVLIDECFAGRPVEVSRLDTTRLRVCPV